MFTGGHGGRFDLALVAGDDLLETGGDLTNKSKGGTIVFMRNVSGW